MLPILYSFRRCPYAIRARLAIHASGRLVELREVSLKAKPVAMLSISPKGQVPVLQLPCGQVLEQSLDIMVWAVGDDWLSAQARDVIDANDGFFKAALDKYKYATRFPESPLEAYRAQGEVFLKRLNLLLEENLFLAGEIATPLDWAVFPFVRQFAGVDFDWFESSPYVAVRRWLAYWLASDVFSGVMGKQAVWLDGDCHKS